MPDVLMPRLSDTMTEGVVGQWLKHEGDIVQRGDTLAEIETDKATMELEAYDSGVLTRIIAPAGSTVPIGQPIAVIDDQTAGAITEPVGEQAVSTAVTDSAPAAVETTRIPCGTRRSRSGPGVFGCRTGARHSTGPQPGA